MLDAVTVEPLNGIFFLGEKNQRWIATSDWIV
jgi:hypothetical protein